jgi:hypothetical protein
MKYLILLCLAGFVIALDYQSPVMIQAGGSSITLAVGHANPLVFDWNGDGLKDLILGQYSSGKIRLYLNEGTNSVPVFSSYTFMQADGTDISLSSG